MHEGEVASEPDRREESEAHARGELRPGSTRLPRGEKDSKEGRCDPCQLPRGRSVAAHDPDDHRHHCGEARDRRDDAHCPGRSAPVVGVETERAGNRRGNGEEDPAVARPLAPHSHDQGDHDQAAELDIEEDAEGTERSPFERAEEVRKPPRQARAQREDDRHLGDAN